MVKKIFLILIVIMSLMSFANADTYLNSCGKSSGWTNGETYILNFTEIPFIYGGSYCFILDNGRYPN